MLETVLNMKLKRQICFKEYEGIMNVEIPVESFDSSKKFLVVAAVDQDLRVVFHRLCEHGQRPSVELLFLSFLELLWTHL